MNKNYYFLLVGVGLINTLKSNDNLDKALAEHLVDYSNAAQLTKNDLGGFFLAQDSYDTRRIQIRSVNQCSTGDEALRGASCGYHALRNGVLGALALINHGEAQSTLKQLASPQHADDFFGTKTSPWRIEVALLRNNKTARDTFRQIVLNSLKPAGKGAAKERDFLTSIIQHDLIVPTPAVWEDGFNYSATKHDVYAALAARCNKLAEQGTRDQKEMSKALNKREVFDKYFSDELLVDFTIDFEGICKRTDSSVLSRVGGVKYGNWLETGEMPKLIAAQKERGILENEPTLLVATYGDDLGGDEQHAVASDKIIQLYSLIRETEMDCVGVVLVYLPGGSPKGSNSSVVRRVFSWFGSWFSSKGFAQEAGDIQSGQDNGHWISLIVSRIKGDLRYYALDSLGNVNRLRDSRINEVIDIFDGKKGLPGYSWTVQQIEKQSSGLSKIKLGSLRSVAKTQLKAEVRPGYSWTQIGVGTLAMGLVAYAAYSVYNDQKKKKNP